MVPQESEVTRESELTTQVTEVEVGLTPESVSTPTVAYSDSGAVGKPGVSPQPCEQHVLTSALVPAQVTTSTPVWRQALRVAQEESCLSTPFPTHDMSQCRRRPQVSLDPQVGPRKLWPAGLARPLPFA